MLGFKQAVTSKRQLEILTLLHQFSQVTNDFFVEIDQIENSTTYKILPAISIFSDNVVISVPIGDDIPPCILIDALFQSITWFAAHALEKKFLIRGGIAKGLLYHNKSIVFGTALIEAYQLESNLACYPRVLLTQEVKNFIKHKIGCVRDFDGLLMLDYFNPSFGLIRTGLQQDKNLIFNIKTRISLFDKIISDNIKSLSFKNKQKELSKWIWFSNHYQSIRNYEQDILTKIEKNNLIISFFYFFLSGYELKLLRIKTIDNILKIIILTARKEVKPWRWKFFSKEMFPELLIVIGLCI